MKRKHIFVLVLVFLLTAVPVGSAFAAPPFQEDTTVETGETIRNDVILFDGDLEVEEGGTITGDVVLFNGDADISGTLKGDLVLFNGDFTADETAVIHGDCVTFNGSIEDNTAEGLGCTSVEGLPFTAAISGLMNEVSTQIDVDKMDEGFDDMPDIHYQPPSAAERFVGGTFGAIARSLLFAALAFVVVTVAPTHLQQVETTIRQKPVAGGTVGFLTAIAVPALAAILAVISAILLLICIGIVGFAIVFAMMAALGIGALFGWIAMGDLLGQWLAGRFDWHKMSPAVIAALGTAILTFGLGFLSAIPFTFGVGLVSMIISFIGLGAVALTKFGTQPYPLVNIVDDEDDFDVDDIKINSVLETLPDDE
jgi:hypothetical protein